MNDKVKTVGMILGVILFIILISGITYAVFGWASDPNTGYIGGTSDCFDITYTKGTDILDGTLGFGSLYTDGLSVSVKAKLSDACNITTGIGTLYLDTKADTSQYLIDNKLIRYQVLEDGTPVDGASGIIEKTGKTEVYTNFGIGKTEKEYTVYIWVSIGDVTDDNIDDISVSSYSGGVSMTAESR